MSGQISQIFRTYWTRSATRILSALWIIFLAGLVYYSTVRTTSFEIAPKLHTPNSTLSIADRSHTTSNNKAKPEDVQSLWVTIGGELNVPDLSPFTNTKAITFSLLSPEKGQELLNQIKQLTHLRTLHVQGDYLPSGLLSSQGKQLRELEIPSAILLKHRDELQNLSQLSLLRVDRSAPISDIVDAVKTIPQLNTLVISDSFWNPTRKEEHRFPVIDPISTLLTKSALQPLAELPHLNAIFANWPWQLEGDRRFLREIHAYPLWAHKTLADLLIPSLMMSAALTFGIFLQLKALFLTPASWTTPGFLRPQIIAVSLLFGIASLLHSGALLLNEFSLLPALTLPLALPSVISLSALCSMSSRRWIRSLGILLFVSISFWWIPIALWRYLPPQLAGNFVWFLQGHFPVFTILILAFMVVIISLFLSQLMNLARRQMELNPSSVLFVSSPQKQSASQWQRVDRSLQGQDSRILQLDFHRGNFWKQVRLQRLECSQYSLRIVAIFVVTFLTVFLAGHSLTTGDSLLTWLRSTSAVINITSQLVNGVLIVLGIPIFLWFKRRSSLATDFCRPANRTSFCKQLLASLLIDQSFALIPVGLLVLYASYVTPETNFYSPAVAYAVVALVTAPIIFAAGAGVFAFKHNWQFGLSAIVIGLFAVLFLAIMVTMIKHPDWNIPTLPIWFYSTAFAALVTGILLNLWIYKKCLEREWC
ncbi:hypothetical protein SH668x_001559 [Planctomicrobium sp. SH668]|uniref:hypothetical protein n=1 Tax=Planctomicrobium sp. SH668 TaxID=3448126 RepID=UPI003F5CA55E